MPTREHEHWTWRMEQEFLRKHREALRKQHLEKYRKSECPHCGEANIWPCQHVASRTPSGNIGHNGIAPRLPGSPNERTGPSP